MSYSGLMLLVLGLALAPVCGADEQPVSYYREVVPILKRSCTGCHHPGKLKGKLDLTNYEVLLKGGKGGPALKPGDAKASLLFEQISGDEPAMPEEGDPLTREEVALIQRWIAQGATNDTPAGAGSFKLAEAPTYTKPPVISALTYSPDGKVLAVSGYHEVLLHSADGSNLLARLVGESPRIESLAFSPDGKWLGVAGGAPARFGEVQIWDLAAALTNATQALLSSWKVSIDSVYGLSFSPDGDRVAAGCADKTVRILAVKDGKELLKFDNHSDWVFGTLWTMDGKRLITGSRDRAMKLIDAASGQFIDDINKLLEPVLCIARHPKQDQVLYGGELGSARLYKISDNQGRTAANNDVNLLKDLERLPGPAQAVAFSPDGATVAVGGAGSEVRVFKAKDGKRSATLKGHTGAIFSIAFHPQDQALATGGFDGTVRLYDPAKGELLNAFVPVPIKHSQTAAK